MKRGPKEGANSGPKVHSILGFRVEGLRSEVEGLSLLVGYHGEPKVNLFHNIRII